MAIEITGDTAIEDLVKVCPRAIHLLIEEGLPCVVCGEPFWGSVRELALTKNWPDTAIETLVTKLRQQCNVD